MIGVKSTLIQSRTNDVGSRSHDLFGVDLVILRTSSSDMVRKETNLFLQKPETGGSASVDSSPDLSLAILSAKYLPKVLIKLLMLV